jgi:hypothetical protein
MHFFVKRLLEIDVLEMVEQLIRIARQHRFVHEFTIVNQITACFYYSDLWVYS